MTCKRTSWLGVTKWRCEMHYVKSDVNTNRRKRLHGVWSIHADEKDLRWHISSRNLKRSWISWSDFFARYCFDLLRDLCSLVQFGVAHPGLRLFCCCCCCCGGGCLFVWSWLCRSSPLGVVFLSHCVYLVNDCQKLGKGLSLGLLSGFLPFTSGMNEAGRGGVE